jgi:hypothetical protein
MTWDNDLFIVEFMRPDQVRVVKIGLLIAIFISRVKTTGLVVSFLPCTMLERFL